MVWPDSVEYAGPAVAGVPEAVEEHHGGGLLDARAQNHRTHRHYRRKICRNRRALVLSESSFF